ncbi:unnamed protein product [Prorocentrum cordatum]|uniref:Apple domain-containing protein n=1 Tax=Prorocentrum cordatum TaxID=2364126 RepID=A0ABN9TCX0_9DINO|nr:unnamed protein product [Polarella glacialis]
MAGSSAMARGAEAAPPPCCAGRRPLPARLAALLAGSAAAATAAAAWSAAPRRPSSEASPGSRAVGLYEANAKTAFAKKLVSDAPMECAWWPPEEGSNGSPQRQCEHGNGLGNGYVYFWNARRGTPFAVCGQSANCDCCRKKVSHVAFADSWRKAREGSGCSNYESIRVFETVHSGSADSCGEYCKAHQGCVGFEFQKLSDQHCPRNSGSGTGACLLWFGECKEDSNGCYDRYEMTTSGVEVAVVRKLDDHWKRTEQMGCANWQSIQLGGTTTAADSSQCAALCDMHASSCKGFGFKTTNTCSDSNSGHIGACVLFGAGKCSFHGNRCWDHYWRMDSKPTTLEATGLMPSSPSASASLAANASSGFAGDGAAPVGVTTTGTTGAPAKRMIMQPIFPALIGGANASRPPADFQQPLGSQEEHEPKPPPEDTRGNNATHDGPGAATLADGLSGLPAVSPGGGTVHGGNDTITQAGDLSVFAADDIAEIEDVGSTAAPRGGQQSRGEVSGFLLIQTNHPGDFINDPVVGAALLELVADLLGVASSRVSVSMWGQAARRLAEAPLDGSAQTDGLSGFPADAPGNGTARGGGDEVLQVGDLSSLAVSGVAEIEDAAASASSAGALGEERGPVIVAFVLDAGGLQGAGELEATLAGLEAAPATDALAAALERRGHRALVRPWGGAQKRGG